MGCQTDLRILAEGLSTCKTQFKNVEFDLTPEEKKSQTESFTYKAEPEKLNSAELYNQQQRELYKVTSHDLNEFYEFYRTRNYKYKKISKCQKVVKYLLTVLDLAEFINNGIAKAHTENNEIRKNSALSKDASTYQILKSTVNNYLDILIEIKIRKDDFYISEFSHYFKKSYDELDSYSRLIITSYAIPDEMSVSFNSLYEGIPLNKFSDKKDLGFSRAACTTSFSQLADKLYTIIHIFLSNLINEFSAYFTSEAFLNNPEGECLFVIPLSMYKKFNFQRSGLTRQEIIFIDNPEDPEKTASNYSLFFKDIRVILNNYYSNISVLKNKLKEESDKNELEWFLNKYSEIYATQTEGKISHITKLCKNEAFREKLTCMLFELKTEMVEIVTAGGNPWEIEEEITTELKNFDKDTCHFIKCLCDVYFNGEQMPNLQFQRAFHFFKYLSSPDKGLSSHLKNLKTKNVKWSSSKRDLFISLLYR